MKSQMKSADRSGARWALIVGRTKQDQEVTLRSMLDRDDRVACGSSLATVMRDRLDAPAPAGTASIPDKSRNPT